MMYEDRDSFGQNKVCVVCSDRALSCNFGAITCESCKAFFRRHAHKEIYGQCDGTCPVSVETRSYCRRCRLAKCFSVGMKKDLILSEEQKQRRRQKIMENRSKRQTQDVYTADSTGIQSDMNIGMAHGSHDTSLMLPPDTESSSSTEGMTAAMSNWVGQHMEGMSVSAMPTGPKRDIWQSIGGEPLPEDHEDAKRQALQALQSGLRNISTGRSDGSINLVTSSDPTDDYASKTKSSSQSSMDPTMSAMAYLPHNQLPMKVPDQVMADNSQSQPSTAYTKSMSDQTVIPSPPADKAKSQLDSFPMEMNEEMLRAMTEPCFFNLKPPSLSAKAYDVLEPHIQHRLVSCVEAYREFCRPMVSIRDKLNPQDYVSLLNSGEECYRQLVRFAKRLPEFRALSQDDQIALLKGNVIEIMIIRFSKCYNLETNLWTFPHCGTMQNVGMIDDDMFSGFRLDDYSNFVRSALDCCQDDDLILVVLIVITLFWPNAATLEDGPGIQQAYRTYVDALEVYLDAMYQERSMVAKVNVVMEQLRMVGKKAHDVMWKSQVSELHPLLKEMFDLR